MPNSPETFQLSLDAAEAYESKFVPALFGEWAPHLVDAAGITPGQSVLDVACGTGVVAREVADRLDETGAVVGVDVNEAMLTIARRLRPGIEWRLGDASALPLADASFDAVLCQAALMFFPDRAQALREMARVAVVDGILAVQVWAALDAQPGYGPFVDVAARHAGPEAVDLLSSCWALGDRDLVGSLLEAAGLTDVSTSSRTGTARFDSIDELVKIEVEGTPLVDRISADVYGRILDDCRDTLAPFRTRDGRAEVPICGHLITARKPAH
jgi:SAM-dependent methyltransferase